MTTLCATTNWSSQVSPLGDPAGDRLVLAGRGHVVFLLVGVGLRRAVAAGPVGAVVVAVAAALLAALEDAVVLFGADVPARLSATAGSSSAKEVDLSKSCDCDLQKPLLQSDKGEEGHGTHMC